jgi:flagellar biosynthesis GTPase FlhF
MDWFKTGIFFALCLLAFLVFHYYVISLPRLEKARVEKEMQDKAKQEEDKVKEDAVEKLAKESVEEREKARRELQEAQSEFERQSREDQARERERQAQEKSQREAAAMDVSFRLCLVAADATYHDDWNRTCGIQGKAEGCALLAPVVANLDQRQREYRDECYKRYPQH